MDYWQERDYWNARGAIRIAEFADGTAIVVMPWIRANAFMGLTRATNQYADSQIRGVNGAYRLHYKSASDIRSERYAFGYVARHYILR